MFKMFHKVFSGRQVYWILSSWRNSFGRILQRIHVILVSKKKDNQYLKYIHWRAEDSARVREANQKKLTPLSPKIEESVGEKYLRGYSHAS